VSEASSDAVSLGTLKVHTDAAPKSEDFSSCTGKTENGEKFAGVSVKVEPETCSDSNWRVAAENETSTSCVKVKSENLTLEDEAVGLKIKKLDSDQSVQSTEEHQPAAQAVSNAHSSDAAENGVETTQQLRSDVLDSDSVSDVFKPDVIQSTNKLENVCPETDVDGLIENDSCKAVAAAASVTVGNVDNRQETADANSNNTASATVSETPCQPVSSEKNCSSVTTSGNSEHQEHSSESTTDLTTATQSKCCSPQRSKKPVGKQGNSAAPDSPSM